MIGKHRQEIIYRLLYTGRGSRLSILILFEYGEVVLVYMLSPILDSRGDVKLQQGEPLEVRHSMIYVSVLGGRIQTYPLRLFQMCLIFIPGLLIHEAKKIQKRIRSSRVIVILGVTRTLKIFLPQMVNFLENFSKDTRSSEMREGALRVSYTINQVVGRIGGVVRRLHIPRVLLYVGKERGRDLELQGSRRNYRRYFILITRLVGARLTPPDVISQVRVARPRRLMRERTIRRKSRKRGRDNVK